MKTNKLESYSILPLSLILGSFTITPAFSQPITPANDGTGTIVTPQGNQFNIEGGTHNGANLFHSFDQFNVNSGQTANFLTTPDTRNILGRVTGGNASIINGIIQVTGGNSNLFLMNPAGIIFGPNARLNIPASFSVTTATGIGFDNNNFWFQAMGTNDYSNLVGNPSGYRFDVSNPGAIVNEGNLNSGENLTLLGGTVINTGELSTTNGNITIAAVEGGSVLRISQPGHLLSLDIDSKIEDISNLDTLSLPELLTGGAETNATSIIVNNNGELVLTDNTIIADTPGNVFLSGNIDLSNQNSESNFLVLANNDITVNNLIETAGFVELTAGKSININGDINTSIGNSNIDIFGNNDEMNLTNRSDGKASINQLDGTTLNAGSGTINIELGNLGDLGDINLASLTTTGEVLVNANGGNIARVSDSSIINAGSVLFQTSGDGGIGLTDAPLRLDVENLEAVSGSGGVFFDVGNVNIGSVSEDVDGIVTAGGDIDIKSDGNVTLTETISTIETVENNSEAEISPPSQGGLGGIEAVEATENTEITDTSGSINIEATGDIVATGSGIKGGGESVSLSGKNITINDEFEETSGDADVKLEARNDITVEDIEDDVLEFKSGGGEIEFRADVDGDGIGVVEMLDNEVDVGSDPNTFENGADTIKTNGRNLTIAGAGIVLGNIDTSWLPVYSGGDMFIPVDAVYGFNVELDSEGNIIIEGEPYYIANIEGKPYLVQTSLDSNRLVDGGNTTITTGGNMTIASVNSSSYDGDGGTIALNAGGDITTTSLNSFSLSLGGNSGNGGAISIEAGGDITTASLNSSSSVNSSSNFSNGVKQNNRKFVSLSVSVNSISMGANITNSLPGNSGNGGAISVSAGGDISTASLASFSNSQRGNSGNGGAISVFAEGDISTASLDSSSASSSNSGNGGAISIEAGGDTSTRSLNSYSNSLGNSENGGAISLSAGGDISTEFLDSSSVSSSNSGNSGAISLSAGGDISTEFLDSSSASSSNSGNGGAIFIEAGGDTSTASLNSYSVSSSNSGNGGAISIEAGGDTSTASLNSYSFSYSFSNSGNSGNGGAISIEAGGDTSTTSLNSYSFSNSGNSGNGGAISVFAGGDITRLAIKTFSFGTNKSGKGGDVNITTNNLSNAEILTLSTHSNSGEVTIESQPQGNLLLSDSSIITSKQVSIKLSENETIQIDVGATQGQSGPVSILSSGNINLNNVTIESDTKGDQPAGNVNIYSLGNITLDNTDILSTTNAQGDAGQITLETDQNIQLTNSSRLQASTEATGNAGTINIQANNLNLDQNTSLITETTGAGNPGSITIEAQTLDIGQDAQISATVLIGSTSTGDGGHITINTNELNITGKLGIFAETEASANAGILTLSPYKDNPDLDINFSNDGFISASTSSTGNGGNIFISAPENIDISGEGFIAVETSGTGNAGIIDIQTENLTISNGVAISASTEDKGNAGQININTTNFTLEKGTSLTTETNSAGKAGDIEITTEKLTIGENAQISATAREGANNTEAGGNISINANELFISGKLGIFAETAGESPAGTLTLNPYREGNPPLTPPGSGENPPLTPPRRGNFDPDLNITFTEKGFISARTTSTGDGGNIYIFAPENINISGEGKISVETTGKGNAGTIDIQTENLNLSEQVAISAETNSAGKAGDININSQTVTIGKGTEISATAGEKATNNEGGGNITINTNDLLISGKLGIFAETEGKAKAGTLTLNPYREGNPPLAPPPPRRGDGDPDLNITFTENGYISARTFSTGNGGDINIKAPENINISGEGRITVETEGAGNAGTIDIQTENLTIAENTEISASTSDSGDGGRININPTQTFQLEGQILTETTGTGKGGTITINTGEMNAPNSTISAKSTDAGNAGTIDITAQENITTGIITSEANNKKETADGGNISIVSEQGEINATQPIQSFSEGANAGNVTLQAKTDIITNTISSHGQQEGGQITIISETGNIDTSNGDFLANYSGGGNAGNLTLEAPQGNITTGNIYSFADADGGQISIKAGGDINIKENSNIISASEPPEGERGSRGVGRGGDIILEAGNNINTTTAMIYSGADDGDTGKINIIAEGAIETGQIDLASGFVRDRVTVNENFTLIPVPQGEATQGTAGDITLNSNNSTIDTTAGTINSRSPDGTGNITLNARGNITTGKLEASALNPNQPTTGGDVNITSEQGEINATQAIETFSQKGTAGNVNITAEGHIHIDTILSQGMEQGGDITINSYSENSIDAAGALNTYSDEGIAGDVTLTSPGSINISSIRSQGMKEGGDITVESEIGEIYSTGDIDSYSEQGKGGNVEVNASESVTLADVSSYGMTESGNLIIESRTAQVETGNVETQADGPSGNVIINGSQITTGNLSSLGTTSAGILQLEATDGSITTLDLSSIASEGGAGGIDIDAPGDVTTEDQTVISEDGPAQIDIDTQGSLKADTQTAEATNGDAEINNQVDGKIDIDNQNAISDGGNATIDNTGQIINIDNQNAISDGGNATIDNTGQIINIDNQNAISDGGNATIDNTGQIINIDNQNAISDGGNATIDNTGQIINVDNQNAISDGGNATIDNTGQIINIPEQRAIAPDGTETITNTERSNTTTPIIPTQTNSISTNNPILRVETNPSTTVDLATDTSNNPILRVETNPSTTVDLATDTSVTIPVNTTQTNINTNSNQSQQTLINNNIIPITTPSNNNQTTNTTTAKNHTESSINNTTNTQQILNIIDTPNTNPLTVATGSKQVVTMLEQNRTNEYSNYFGKDFNEQFISTKNVRDILTDMAYQTGKESAVVYINAYPEQLQIILYTKSGQPIIKTIAKVDRQKLMEVVLELKIKVTTLNYRNTDKYLSPAQKLYDWLIAPISAELKAANIETLLFSMDEGLRTLPVAALHDGKQFLIEKYSLSLIPSVSLMDTNYRPLQDTQVLAMGASEFIEQNPLPAVPVELENIAQHLWQGNMFLNEDFTLDNLVIQRESNPYPIIHLATHANFRPGKASNSYIQLWGTEQIKLNEMRELGWNEPAVELLVLSACRTAIGDRNAELGFAGLAIAAGVKSALASVWYVNDEGTLGLITEFYSHLNNVKIKAEALRKAQLAMLRGEVVIADGELRGSGVRGVVPLPPALENIENYNLSHPYYWAGFTMVGSPW
ncbi:CHAT domain-containing protein [Okeania sp. KiyG1]|uniref:CHAT domain-containing protein n=1 Tax=Okeania sp. KiyG1 TaxID=2720165 RepID=UPI001922EF8F|nr:CHAT domain-containing protein [Okeania sp. KiyG1]GGA30808.1 hypothetical protein CYANOKiyG1_47430 [Okeania sp. KiyG1]